MKKSILFLFALFMCYGANAQTLSEVLAKNQPKQEQVSESTQQKSQHPFIIGAQLGMNVSSLITSGNLKDPKVGLNVGITVEKSFTDRWAMKAAILYTMKGAKQTSANGSIFGQSIGNTTRTYSPAYLEIPVLATYKSKLSTNLRLDFDLGLYVAFGLHGKNKYKITGSSLQSVNHEGKGEPVFKYLKKFDLGFIFGPSITFREKYVAGLAYELSIPNISDMGGVVRSSNFMINLGYKFVSL